MRPMKTSTFLFFSLVWVLPLPASDKAPVGLLSVGPQPESVTLGFAGDLFVTLMGEQRSLGDGDGSIVRVSGREVTRFCDGFDDPKGIVFTGSYLVTADFDTVWKIDRDGNRSVLAGPSDFPEAPFMLNDVAVEPDGRSVLVTDMGAVAKMKGPDGSLWPLDSPEGLAIPALGRVYRISMDGKVTVAIDRGGPMRIPNGIDALADGTIRLAEFFSGDLLDWKDGKWSIVGQGHRGADGVVQDAQGAIYLSEVYSGKVFRLSAPGAEPVLIAALNSAADHCLDPDEGVLIVPDTKAGQLAFVPVD